MNWLHQAGHETVGNISMANKKELAFFILRDEIEMPL
jgi:hypothetical protein